jgi:predicted permease
MIITLRCALRQLLKSPGFTATAVATLAICLGANLAIFAVIDAMLLRPLPVADSERLVTIMNSYPLAGDARAINSIANYFDRRGAIQAFSSLSIYKETSVVVGRADHTSRVDIALISPEFFATLGVPLSKGRPFTDAEMVDGADNVAVITDGFWRSYFDSDPNVIGSKFQNDGAAVTVVGILPPGFHFPPSRAQFYRPMSYGPYGRNPWMRHTNNGGPMVARLAPGVSLAQAQAQMDSFNALQLKDDPIAKVITDAGYRTRVLPFREDLVRGIRPTLILLEGGVLCLMLIGSVNLANLLLIRAGGRVRETAVRKALGARRRHLIADAFAESALLALGGGALGLLVGTWGIHLLRSLGTNLLPLGELVAFNGRIAGASLAATVLAGLLLTLPVIGFNLHSRVAGGLQSESYGGTSGRRIQRIRGLFVVAQVSFACVLLSCAVLLAASLKRVLETPAGFRPRNLVTGVISLPGQNYKEAGAPAQFVERLLPAVRSIPGIEESAVTGGMPFAPRMIPEGPVAIEGITPKTGEALPLHQISATTSDYWRIMGIPLIEGRLLEDSDERSKSIVCVVEQAFARRYWPGKSAVGRRISIGLSLSKDDLITVVGVVGDVKLHELTEEPGTGMVYLPFSYGRPPVFSLVVRSSLPPDAVAPMLQKAVRRIDPQILIEDLRPVQARIDDSLVVRRSPAILAGLFAGIALLLAAVGTYGVLSYAVTQRLREIGIRMAIGARPGQVCGQFLAAGLRLVALGGALGLLGAWAARRAMQGILFGIPALSGATLLVMAVILGAVAVPACLLPARRAANVDPATVLRAE